MVDIPKKRLNGYLGPEFDDFLFATIGIDQRGGPLSVISALARLDLDPWAEAAKLARLPGEAAAQKLASWLSCNPDLTSDSEDRHQNSRRLIDLLPKRGSVHAKARNDKLLSYRLSNPYACLIAFFITLSILLMVQPFSKTSPDTSITVMTSSGGTALPATTMRPRP
jgi:hypothetical protein